MSVPCCQTMPIDPRNLAAATTSSRLPISSRLTASTSSSLPVDPRSLNFHHQQQQIKVTPPAASAASPALTVTPTPSPGSSSAQGYSSGGEATSPESVHSHSSMSPMSNMDPNSPPQFKANSPASDVSLQHAMSPHHQAFSPQQRQRQSSQQSFSSLSSQHSFSNNPSSQEFSPSQQALFPSTVFNSLDPNLYNNVPMTPAPQQQSMMDMLGSPSSFHTVSSQSSLMSLNSPQNHFPNELVSLPY